MNKNLYFILYDFLWLIGFIIVSGIALLPVALLGQWIFETFHRTIFILSLPLLFYLFMNLFILVSGVLCRISTPKLKEGNFKINSKQFLYWRINWHFYSYVFLFFRRYLYYSKTIRYVFLRLMRVNITFSTYFAEMVDIQDANNLISIGKNSGLGTEVLLAAHLLLGRDVIVFRKITIGDNVLISARGCLAPGVTIGDNVIIGFNTLISLNVSIGAGSKVGSNVLIHNNAKIGKNCKIGQHVIIPQDSIVLDNTVIKDFTQYMQN
jgi:acetyltransferase-like isoleucine patch superfamily enzyme